LVYAKDGDSFIVVASNGGADRPPGWLYNVTAQPAVEVQLGRRRLDAAAEVVGPDDARYAALWKLANERNHGRYDQYQAKTSPQNSGNTVRFVAAGACVTSVHTSWVGTIY